MSTSPIPSVKKKSHLSTPAGSLTSALSQGRLEYAWKQTVRQGLRNQDLPDLHDHLDVHWRLSSLAARLHDETVGYTYRPREPQIVRLEKSLGINRRTVIPAPSDAIVLQAVVNAISPEVLGAEPTNSAFYSQSHRGSTKSMTHLDETFPSDWLQLWKEGQRRIWQFTSDYPVIVITDIANYFDAIPLSQLRNRLSSLGHFDENLLDLLFFGLESLTWRPEYLPRSGAGLPQIQFDAPRLLAHAYLYEADELLASNGDFVRWMDDITFGANSVTAGKRVLRDLDEQLSALGVRLNTKKTQILPSAKGVVYFRMHENRALTTVQNILDLNPSNPATRLRTRKYIRSFWRRFHKGDRFGYWDKIMKRLFKLFGEIQDPYLQRWVFDLIAAEPSLRGPAFRYLRAIGYSRARFVKLRRFLESDDCLDDAALFGGARLLVDWVIPERSKSKAEAIQIAQTLSSRSTAGCCAALWLACKYGTEQDVGQIAIGNHRQWHSSEWASRQVAAATPRMSDTDFLETERIIGRYGLLEGGAVLSHFRELRSSSQFT